MSSSRVTPTASAVPPRAYAHNSKAEWGHAVIAEELSDRTKYVFENAGERTFMNGHSAIHEVELPADEREALAKQLLRRAPASSTKKRSSTAKTKASTEPAMTFERQQAIFGARYANGFADAKYSHEERGTPEGRDRNLDALIALARELFAAARLDKAIAGGGFEDVYTDAVKVLVASSKLSFPKADKPTFEKMPPSGHERFATALRDLLHGQGAYNARFDAFVKSLATKSAPWTIATIFSAAVHPEAHVLVKPTVSQRQARALGLAEPPIGAPTGT
ncbi:MAG: hypothetical protein M3Y87_34265, partial [Myxococcota bacterium]|nr:hypothetical protein [Myxococcota bacterium]